MNKFPLNLKQSTLVVISMFGLILFLGWGHRLPFNHPINITLYIILGLIIIILGFILIKPTYCPKCGTRLPVIRRPQDKNESLYGWSTCPKCKTQIDTKGNIVKK